MSCGAIMSESILGCNNCQKLHQQKKKKKLNGIAEVSEVFAHNPFNM